MKEVVSWLYGLVVLALIIVGIWVGFKLFLWLLFLFFVFLVVSRLRNWFMYKTTGAYRTKTTKSYGEKVEQIKD